MFLKHESSPNQSAPYTYLTKCKSTTAIILRDRTLQSVRKRNKNIVTHWENQHKMIGT